jgi:hypothetical protein
MPTKGTVKCRVCNVEIEGELPDHRPTGTPYGSYRGQPPVSGFDPDLAEKIFDHHELTKNTEIRMRGHKDFDVFLENGRRGVIENTTSYSLAYKEIGG